MTTIAYKNGIIAYDSRISQGPTVVDDNGEKMIKEDGYFYFTCGFLSDAQNIIDIFRGRIKYDKDLDCDISVFVVTPEIELWQSSVDPGTDSFWKIKRRLDNHWACGSGGDHALTAMDCGLSAKDAVKMAAKRDKSTGGKIRMFKVIKK